MKDKLGTGWVVFWITLLVINCFNLGVQCGDYRSMHEICKGIHGKDPDKAKLVKGKLQCLYLTKPVKKTQLEKK